MQCAQCGAVSGAEGSECVQCTGAVNAAQHDAEIWNPNAAANWSLVFSPAFGAYLQMLNWRALGEPEKAEASKRWFQIGLAIPAIYLLMTLALEQQLADALSRLLGFGFLLAWYFQSGRAQSRYVKERFGKDYLRRPWGKALMYGVGALLAYTVLAAIVGAVYGALSAATSPSTPGF